MGEENLAPAGFDPRTVQAVKNRHTTALSRPTDVYGTLFNIILKLYLNNWLWDFSADVFSKPGV
jgi:hypothetical protein